MVPDDPAVPGGVVEHRGDHPGGHIGWALGQPRQQGRGQQGHVAVEDQDRVVGRHLPQTAQADPGRVPGTQLLGLHHRHHVTREMGIDVLRPVTDDHHRGRRAQGSHRLENPSDQGPAGRNMRHLGEIRLHPLALAGGEDDDMDRQQTPHIASSWGGRTRTRSYRTKTCRATGYTTPHRWSAETNYPSTQNPTVLPVTPRRSRLRR